MIGCQPFTMHIVNKHDYHIEPNKGVKRYISFIYLKQKEYDYQKPVFTLNIEIDNHGTLSVECCHLQSQCRVSTSLNERLQEKKNDIIIQKVFDWNYKD